jgi:hypothetical protein
LFLPWCGGRQRRVNASWKKRFCYVQKDILHHGHITATFGIANNSCMNDPLSFVISVRLFAFSVGDQTRIAERVYLIKFGAERVG